MRAALFTVLIVLTSFLPARAQVEMASTQSDVYGSTSCMGCHGLNAMGGLGPPLAGLKLTPEAFAAIVRSGKGMMPRTTPDQMDDSRIQSVYKELQSKPWDESQIPIAFKVGNLLTTHNVARLFSVAGLVSLLLSLWVLRHWLRLAQLKDLRPAIAKLGYGRAAAVFCRSLIVDGLFVSSLWKADKRRWFMHGMMLYGFLGLGLADILIQVNDPSRAKLPLGHPLKVFAVVCGAAVITGVLFVMVRYKRDKYIDNGVTLGRDFLFVNLLLHSIFSGFLTVMLGRSGAFTWVMPVYIYHLLTVLTLIVSMPFTRMNHIFIVPVMAAVTAVVDDIVDAGVDIGFVREPSPGRHHKSTAIARGVLKEVDPEAAERFRLRYYP